MTALRVLSADFEISAVAEAGWPAGQLPEVAFSGRSNVGKSSAINVLLNRKKLARVSNTPGRTQLVNFFRVRVGPASGTGPQHEIRFADLPGYGYARVPAEERRKWKGMVEEYITKRSTLRGLITLVDAEIGPTPLDEELLSWLSGLGRRPLILATKLDRVGKSRQRSRMEQIAASLGTDTNAVVGFSAHDRAGVDRVWSAIAEICGL